MLGFIWQILDYSGGTLASLSLAPVSGGLSATWVPGSDISQHLPRPPQLQCHLVNSNLLRQVATLGTNFLRVRLKSYFDKYFQNSIYIPARIHFWHRNRAPPNMVIIPMLASNFDPISWVRIFGLIKHKVTLCVWVGDHGYKR
jgi:hypothetical protein